MGEMMIVRVTEMLMTIISSLVLIKGTASLECFICGEENLDEYGECHAQFRYDCTSYAKNFEPTEAIYCRTVRKRVMNGNYTILKECISEQDHYRKYPPKHFLLNEECNLIDAGGNELAYCLCQRDLCNGKNIVEQFMDFEEQHPEIFGFMNDNTNKREDIKPETEESTKNFDRNLKPLALNGRMPNVNYNEEYLDYVNSGPALRQTSFATQSSNMVAPAPSLSNGNEPIMFLGSIAPNLLPLQDNEREPMDNFFEKVASEQVATMEGIEQKNIEEGYYCYSCTETLNDPTKDCMEAMLIQCLKLRNTGKSQLCITKQTRTSNNLYKLEKRCSTEMEQQEIIFGELFSRKIICTATMDGSQAYCICLGSYCNKESLLAQAENEAQRLTNSNISIDLPNKLTINEQDGNKIASVAFIESSQATNIELKNKHLQVATMLTPSRRTSSISNLSNRSFKPRLIETKLLEHRWQDNTQKNRSRKNICDIIIITSMLTFLTS